MDINTLRIAITLVSLILFLGIVISAYRPSAREAQEMRALGILEDGEDRNAP
jgi:cbb3-type cytochrome oxidase subunit 3